MKKGAISALCLFARKEHQYPYKTLDVSAWRAGRGVHRLRGAGCHLADGCCYNATTAVCDEKRPRIQKCSQAVSSCDEKKTVQVKNGFLSADFAGYHFVVAGNGDEENPSPLTRAGAHARSI